MGPKRPVGFYKTAKEWSLATSNQHHYKQVYTRLSFPEALSSFEANPIDRPEWSDDAYVAIMNNGRIFGKNGAVITPDNKLLWDVSLEWFTTPETHTIFEDRQLPPLSHTDDNVGALTHQAPSNYYHWMYEVLPRIHLIDQSGLGINRYVINDNQLPFQINTLSALGINERNIIRTNDNFHLQAKRLIVPSLPQFATKWAHDFLREKLLSLGEGKLDGYERIYIIRKNFRKVLNESEILEILSDYGFKAILLEQLPIEKQISIFRTAKVVIGPHGAGLTNLTFSNPGTKVIELMPSSYISALYFLISSFGNLKYFCLVGEGKTHPDYKEFKVKNFDNIIIDPKAFRDTLTKADIED